jgi:hypothetical protein
MKKNLLYFLLIFRFSLFSQTTFTRSYNQDTINNLKYSFDESHLIFEYKNSLFTIGTFEENVENSGITIDGIPDTTHAMLMKFDQMGDLKARNFYTSNSCYNDIYNYTIFDGYFVAAGLIYSPKNFCGFYDPDNPPPNIDKNTKRRILVTSTDLENNKSTQNVYQIGEDSYPFGIVKTNDNNLFIGSVTEKNRVLNLLKINQYGDSLDNKVIYDSIPFDYEPFFLDKTDTGYLIGFKSLTSNVSHFDILNNNGDTISFKNFSLSPNAISKTMDKGYIILTSEGTKPKLTKLDKNLQIEWQNTYNLYANSFVRQTKDGNYVLGTKDFAKVSKDSILWQQRYFGASNISPWYFIFDAIETSDEGFALTGFYEANTFIIKTDCKGSLTWNETCTKLKQDDLSNLIYPNPFNEELNIQISNTNNATIRITDLLGKVLLKEKMTDNNLKLNTTSFASGVYICQIYSQDILLKSTKLIKHQK